MSNSERLCPLPVRVLSENHVAFCQGRQSSISASVLQKWPDVDLGMSTPWNMYSILRIFSNESTMRQCHCPGHDAYPAMSVWQDAVSHGSLLPAALFAVPPRDLPDCFLPWAVHWILCSIWVCGHGA